LVANQGLTVPPSKYISTLQVAAGFAVADDEIVKLCEPGDLVITADIPLAAEVIEKGALALNPRGEVYSKANIGSILNMRDFMDTMRSSGVQSGGPAPLGNKDKQAFANKLDAIIAKAKRQQQS
jgi:uncharacterized protein YaiI (UPF0178 family)